MPHIDFGNFPFRELVIQFPVASTFLSQSGFVRPSHGFSWKLDRNSTQHIFQSNVGSSEYSYEI
jgi:hypothetical protein